MEESTEIEEVEEEVEEEEEEQEEEQHKEGGAHQFDLVGDREHQTYNMLKDRIFLHTPVYDDSLLSDIGMDYEFSPYGKPPGGTTFTP